MGPLTPIKIGSVEACAASVGWGLRQLTQQTRQLGMPESSGGCYRCSAGGDNQGKQGSNDNNDAIAFDICADMVPLPLDEFGPGQLCTPNECPFRILEKQCYAVRAGSLVTRSFAL